MKTVLVVDDSAFVRKFIVRILTKDGMEVIGEAGNGEEAVARYRELHPDIVTLDITMPVMDGIRALKEIMALSPRACVIMISAMGQDILVREAMQAGAADFLVKPFKPEALSALIGRLVKKERRP